MAHTARRTPCTQCRRRRQRFRNHSPLLNALCLPVARWSFTILTVVAIASHLTYPALAAGALAYAAWRYR